MAIDKKLLEFQKLGITVEKDAANPFFKSRYTSLNQVLEKIKKPLNDLGIVIIQRGSSQWEAGKGYVETGLTTELYDTEDGTSITSFVPYVGATDMQKLGSAISYARRYALIALLCLEDADDDGESAIAPRNAAKGVVDQTEAPNFKL
jgi:hypothetical protein